MRLTLFAVVLVLMLMVGMKLASRSHPAAPRAVAHATAPAPTPAQHPADPHQYSVGEKGIGPIVLGATLDGIERSIGEPFRMRTWSNCEVEWLGAPQGVTVIGEGGTVSRIDVRAAGVVTENGIGVGDDSMRVREVYSAIGKQVEISPGAAVVELGSGSTLSFDLVDGRVQQYHLGSGRYDRRGGC